MSSAERTLVFLGGAASALALLEASHIAVDVAGDGPPLVLIHGITSSGEVWSPVLDALGAEHVTAARSRGLSYSQAVWKHVIPNSLLPLTTMVAVWFAGLLGGSDQARIR